MTLCVVPLTVSHHPVRFGSHGHCSRVDIIILVAEGQYSTCSRLNPPSLLISEAHDMPCSPTRDISGRRHISFPMCPTLVTFVCKLHEKLLPVSSNTATRRKRRRIKQKDNCKAFCVTRKRNNPDIGHARPKQTEEKYANNFCQSVEKRRREGGRKSKKLLTA